MQDREYLRAQVSNYLFCPLRGRLMTIWLERKLRYRVSYREDHLPFGYEDPYVNGHNLYFQDHWLRPESQEEREEREHRMWVQVQTQRVQEAYRALYGDSAQARYSEEHKAFRVWFRVPHADEIEVSLDDQTVV